MRVTMSVSCLCALLSFSTAFADAPAKRIPVRDFFRNPEMTGFQISPDGKMLSFLKPWESRLNVHVRPVAGGEGKRLTSIKDRDISNSFWKENTHILYVRDFGGDENYHVFSVNVKTGEERDLTPWPGVRASVLDDLEEISRTDILVTHNRRNQEVFDVYRVNVATGKETLVAKNPGGVVAWITDHAGKVRVGIQSDGVNGKVLYRENEGRPFKVIKTYDFKESFAPYLFTADNRNLYVGTNTGRDKESLVEYDPRTNKEVRILYQHSENDVGRPFWSRKLKTLIGLSVVTWKSQYVFFNPAWEQAYRRLEEKLGDVEVRYVSWNRNEDRLIVRTFSDRSLGAFHLYDVKKGEVTELAQLGAHLPSEELASMRPIQYTSRDGLTIHGYLTLPKGKLPRKLPVVVNPHGGPWHRDVWRYNPEVQMLANRGYAVLQMNFRGSTGYGREFWQASFKEWGKKMQDDVTDGVQWLVSQGIADPKRICIYGGSYGGYATLAGLAFTPDLYRCGVDYVGVSNLFTFMNTIPPYWKPFLEQLYEMVGHPEKDKELLASASPALHADKIKAALFIAQGAKDPRVVKAESDQMVEALRKRGVEAPYMVKDNEGHGFANEENRFEFYEAMESFLKKHLN